jgi:hypothetical protein
LQRVGRRLARRTVPVLPDGPAPAGAAAPGTGPATRPDTRPDASTPPDADAKAARTSDKTPGNA